MAETFSFLTVRFDGQNSPIPAFRAVDTMFSPGLPPPQVQRKMAKGWMFDFLSCWKCTLLLGLRAKPVVLEKKRAQAKKQDPTQLMAVGPAGDSYS